MKSKDVILNGLQMYAMEAIINMVNSKSVSSYLPVYKAFHCLTAK